MVCALFEPIDVKVFVEINNLVVNLKGESGGKTTVTALSWAKFDGMKTGEKLFLCGHGTPTEVGGRGSWYSPAELADTLVSKGLPGHTKSIRLLTCNSGTYDDDPDLSYCARLASEIALRAKFKVPVLGFTGYQVTNEYGQTRAKSLVKRATHSTEYAAIFARWQLKLGQWERLAETLPTDSGEAILGGARQVATMSKQFFKELYEHNTKVVQSMDESKLWK